MKRTANLGSTSNSHRNKALLQKAARPTDRTSMHASQYCFFIRIEMLSVTEKAILRIWSQSRANFLLDFI